MASPSQTVAAPRRRGLQPGAARLVGLVGRVRELGLVIALLVIVAVVALQEPRFLDARNLRQILVSVSILAVVAAGQTLVVLTRNVDLSVASMVGLTAYVVRDLLKEHPDLGVAGAIAVGCALGVALGAINGALVTLGQVPAIVATLGTLYVYRGIDFWYAGGQQINPGDTPAGFRDIARTAPFGVPTPIVIAVGVVLVVAYALRYTRTGRELYAVGSNPDAARLAGLPRDRLVFGAFVASGLLSGLGGILWAARFGTIDSSAARYFELQVVAAVVLVGVNIFGGAGTVVGAALGAIMLGSIQNALTILRLNQFWLQAISGAAILIAVTIDALITRRLQRALVARRNR